MVSWKKTANKSEGEAYEKAPPGNQSAVLVGIFDMGTQESDYKGDVKKQHRLYFVWELVTKPMTGMKSRNHHIAIDLTYSLNEKAKLRKWVEARLGKALPDGGEYEIADELGKPCLLNVVMNGDYPKIEGMSALPDGMPCPPAKTPITGMGLDDYRAGKAIPDWVPYLFGEPLAEHIKRCEEYKSSPVAVASSPRPQAPAASADGQTADAPASWDYMDGKIAVRGVTTQDVQSFINRTGIDVATLRVKPTGGTNSTAKTAKEWGFSEGIPF